MSTDQFGTSVASAGDVNGDGYSDLIVGAPQDRNNVGTAFVFFAARTLGFMPVPRILIGPSGLQGQFGSSVFGATNRRLHGAGGSRECRFGAEPRGSERD